LPLICFGQTSGEVCSTGNFTKDFGAVRNSGGAEWCWANTAADLIGYAQGIKPPERISTIDVAVSNLTISSDVIEQTIKRLKTVDMKESRIPWYKNQIASSQDLMKSFPLREIVGVSSTALLSYQSRKGFCLERNLESTQASSNSYIADYIETVRDRIGPEEIQNCANASPSAIKNIQKFNLALNSKILTQIEKDLEKQCEPRSPMRPMLPSTVVLNADPLKRSATDFLKLGLNNGLPLAIVFDHHVLTGGSYSKAATHVGIVTESRLDPASGLCEYRLRDSNGADCHIYREALRNKCDKGHIWLTSQEINDSTEMLMAVDKPKD
jgi:hypothetical protein